MKNNLTLTPGGPKWKRFRAIWLIAIVLVCGSAWLYFDYRFPSWNEEVMLSDGRLLSVHRRHEYIEGYGVRRTWLTFSLPEMGGRQTWTEWMYPAIVDVNDGKVYVVGYAPGFKQFSSYLNPRYLLVAYVWNGTSFARIPLLSVPEKIRQQWNVLPCSSRGEFTTSNAKKSGWCGQSGTYELGVTREINLIRLEAIARRTASIYNESTFSE